MAYIGNQLAQIASTMAQFGSPECEFTENFYAHATDSLATILGANYISDGQKRGLVLNSVVWVQTATGFFLCEVSALQATSSGYGVTLTQMGQENGINLPATQYTTGALTAATLTAAQIAGAQFVVLNNSGATPGAQTLPAVSVIAAAIPNAQPGFSYLLRIVNSQASGTLTLTVDSGATWTITGHAAILLSTWVEYIVTLTSLTAGTIQSIGAGDAT